MIYCSFVILFTFSFFSFLHISIYFTAISELWNGDRGAYLPVYNSDICLQYATRQIGPYLKRTIANFLLDCFTHIMMFRRGWSRHTVKACAVIHLQSTGKLSMSHFIFPSANLDWLISNPYITDPIKGKELLFVGLFRFFRTSSDNDNDYDWDVSEDDSLDLSWKTNLTQGLIIPSSFHFALDDLCELDWYVPSLLLSLLTDLFSSKMICNDVL